METVFFDIVTRVLQRDTFASYLFILYLDCILRTLIDLIKEDGFTLRKVKRRQYPAETIKDTDDVDDLMFLANIPAQDKSLLHSLAQAAGGIGLYVNAHKTVHVI